MRRLCALCLLLTWAAAGTLQADDPVFSGPQAGEKLPPLTVKGVIGPHAEKEVDPVTLAEGKPLLLIFVHKRTRPAFGLTNAVMRYAAERQADGLTSAVVFLPEDATETEKWMRVVQQHFPEGIDFGLSPDGQEGPGAYGLNRNVTLTVLVAKDGRVQANFALVQPGLQVDGPKILKAVVAAVGSGEVPEITTLAGPAMRRPTQDDPNLTPLLRALLNRDLTPDEVDAAAKKVEAYVADHPAAARELGEKTNRVVGSGKLENYGTPAAQAYLKKWAEKHKAPTLEREPTPKPRTDDTKPPADRR